MVLNKPNSNIDDKKRVVELDKKIIREPPPFSLETFSSLKKEVYTRNFLI